MALQASPSALSRPCTPVRLAGALPIVPGAVHSKMGGVRAPLRRAVIAAAEKKTGSSVDVDKIVDDLKGKWEDLEDKNTVLAYGGAALVAVWIAGSIVNAVDGVPLLPKLFELVGLLYGSWFVYRYVLFKSNREELVKDFDDLLKKISGDAE